MKDSIIKSYNTIILIIVVLLGFLMVFNWTYDIDAGMVFIVIPIIFFVCKFILELFLIDPDKNSKSIQNNKTNNIQNVVDENTSNQTEKKTNDWDEMA